MGDADKFCPCCKTMYKGTFGKVERCPTCNIVLTSEYRVLYNISTEIRLQVLANEEQKRRIENVSRIH